jgi:Rha family phage regulatory protein
VSDVFDREHRSILRGIDNIIKDIDDNGEDSEGGGLLKFQEIYFIENSYKVNNRTYREYLLTKDGFTLLVVGYDSNEAKDFKVAYAIL